MFPLHTLSQIYTGSSHSFPKISWCLFTFHSLVVIRIDIESTEIHLNKLIFPSAKSNQEGMSTSTTHTPTAEEIVIIAGKYGYTTSSPEHNATLYFKKSDGCQLNVYHSTRGVMTFLDHPTRGRNGLWRSDVYTTTTDLEALFENPRKHTSTGYRKSENAEAGCTQCGERKKRTEFSKNQWTKRKEDKQKCASCIADGKQSSLPKTRE